MLQRMSIGKWFKGLFSSSAHKDAEVADETNYEKVDINEARIDAGGSGILGVGTHDSPGEEAGRHESELE
jgi:hypothetical protein